MALDFIVFDRNHRGEQSVSLEENEHALILAHSKDFETPPLDRASEFYCDSEYAPSELPALREEILGVLNASKQHPTVVRVAGGLTRLIDLAISLNKSIFVVSD